MASGKKNYFRHSIFARNDDFIDGLIKKFGPAGYFYWFVLVELCAEQCADEMLKTCKFHESRLYRELRCNSRRLQPVMDYMRTSCKLYFNHTGNYYEIGIVNLPKYMGRYTNKKESNAPNKRKEKKRKEKEKEKTVNKYISELDKIYLCYPKHFGKTKGLEKLKTQIKSVDDVVKFSTAVDNYKKDCINNNTETKYIKNFDTFCTKSNWIDWICPESDHNWKEAEKQLVDNKILEVFNAPW